MITDKQFINKDVFHTRLFPSDFGFIWCFTYDPPDDSPSGGEGQVRFNQAQIRAKLVVIASNARKGKT